MPAFLSNMSWGEIAIVGILAVMIFGKRLPQVAGDLMRNVVRLRRQLEDLRRESGIDRELLGVRETFHDLQRDVEARTVPPRPFNDRREPPRLATGGATPGAHVQETAEAAEAREAPTAGAAGGRESTEEPPGARDHVERDAPT